MRYLLYITLLFAFFSAWADNIYTQDKNTITLSSNQPEFTIKLKSNPTTGYMWSIQSYDKKYLLFINHHFEPPSNTKLMGAPGYEYFTFKGTKAFFSKPQGTDVKLIYSRSWENNQNIIPTVFHVLAKRVS